MDRKPIFMSVDTETAEILADGRHVLCPQYDTCLDEAVYRNQRFHCNGCLYKHFDVKAYILHNGRMDETAPEVGNFDLTLNV
jgi:hypothetical protein